MYAVAARPWPSASDAVRKATAYSCGSVRTPASAPRGIVAQPGPGQGLSWLGPIALPCSVVTPAVLAGASRYFRAQTGYRSRAGWNSFPARPPSSRRRWPSWRPPLSSMLSALLAWQPPGPTAALIAQLSIDRAARRGPADALQPGLPLGDHEGQGLDRQCVKLARVVARPVLVPADHLEQRLADWPLLCFLGRHRLGLREHLGVPDDLP